MENKNLSNEESCSRLASNDLFGGDIEKARRGYCENCKLFLKTEYGGIYGWCYTCNGFRRVAPIPEKAE